jgi:hypothetical protein
MSQEMKKLIDQFKNFGKQVIKEETNANSVYAGVKPGHQGKIDYSGKQYTVKVLNIYNHNGHTVEPTNPDAMVGVEWSLDGKTLRQDTFPIESVTFPK